MPALLQIEDLVVDFDGFKAIDDLDLYVDEGELRFLIGPNGAGKTTLIDLVTGLTKATSGTIKFDGRYLGGLRPHEIVRLGVGRTFQTPSVFDRLTVLENVDLAASFRSSLRGLLRQRRGRVLPEVADALEQVGLDG